MKRFAFLLATTSGLLFGQASGANFSGPLLGFVPGASARELLPIRGIPGAARLGDPIRLPATVLRTYLAPGHVYALAAQGPQDPIAVITLRGASGIAANPAVTPISSAMAHADLIAFSQNGAAAALYSEQAGRIQVFTGLPNSPQVSEEISNISLAAAARALAVSDDAQAVLIADSTGTVYALQPNAAPVAVYHASQVSALAFVSRSHDAIVCDPVLGSAALLQSSGLRILQPPSANACVPRAAASTADGKTVLIACPAQHVVWSVDRASGTTAAYGMNAGAMALDRLGGRDAFLLSPPDSNGTYWLLTWDADGPAVSFIGAAHALGAGNR